jgi:Kef-type K+ transport system membrane component KefB
MPLLAALSPADVNIRILIAVATVLVAARLCGWLVSKVGQPQVHGEILSGIILGPSLLGLVWPGANDFLFPAEIVGALKVLAQLGLVLFMFLIGLELDLPQLRGQGHKAVVISHASILLPVLLGSALGWWLYPRFGGDASRLGFVLFLGAAMGITAFPVLARVLQETGLYRTRVGVLTMTCAAVDDVTAWCVLAVVVAVVKATGFTDALTTIALALGFVAVMLGGLKPLLARLPAVPVWAALALALASAWLTEEIGIHAIFGAFLAGAIMPRGHGIQAEIKQKLETATLVLLLPVFFVVVGLATRIDLLDRADLWGITLVVIAAAIVGKWGGSAIAARLTGEAWREAHVIGILMNTRGLTELVILSVGLELGVIGPTIFTIMVLMALVTTLMATPLLALVAPDYRHRWTPAHGSEVPSYGGSLDGVIS